MAEDPNLSQTANSVTALEGAPDRGWQYLRSLIHELRSVLTTMKISAEILASPRADEAEYRRRYSALITEQTGRVARLLEDFSEVYRPALPTAGATRADLNLAAETAAAELAGIAHQVGASITVRPATGEALVAGDPPKITQALRGFLEYLLGVAPAGSDVELAVSAPQGEKAGSNVTFSLSGVDRPASGSPDLDWGRVNLAAARQIVEVNGGHVSTGEGAESAPLLTVSWPRNAKAVSLALTFAHPPAREASARGDEEAMAA
jgi:signal transduction histidine kinase